MTDEKDRIRPRTKSRISYEHEALNVKPQDLTLRGLLTVSTIDSLLAATALHHNLALVTRNARDFDCPGLEVINPFG